MSDPLDDLFNAEKTVDGQPRKQPPADHKTAVERFEEKCIKCGGTGTYRGRSQYGSRCFECKGVGKKVFKTSAADRSKARAGSQARKARVLEECIALFHKAFPHIGPVLEAKAAAGNSFAISLLGDLGKYGDLSPGKVAAVERMIEADKTRKEEAIARVEAAPLADTAGVDRLKTAFDTAIEKSRSKGLRFRWPKITLGNVVISPAGDNSKNPGALYVKSPAEGYLGKVAGGKFIASRECTPEAEQRVLAFIADPKAAAIAYGVETGICCVCNATLTSEWRLKGIGPVCAKKFGW